MKRNFVLYIVVLGLGFIFYHSTMSAQPKYDYNWVIASNADGNPGIDAYVIDFNYGKRSLREISAYNIIHHGVAAISNREGELQFFTNGCEIMDTIGGIIMNGDTLISGQIYDLYCYLGIYPSIQNSTIIPDHRLENHYYYLQKEVILGELNGGPQYCILIKEFPLYIPMSF